MGYTIALLIGLLLGMIGGGGAILTIPLVTIFFGVDLYAATSYSLVVVSFASMVGIIQRLKEKNFAFKEAIVFVIPSTIVAFLLRLIVMPNLDIWLDKMNFPIDRNLMINILLIILLVYIGLKLIIKKPHLSRESIPTQKIIFMGVLTGLLSGFLGAGGGFIIVPILIGMGIETKKAVGTSMIIVTIQSVIGIIGDFLGKSETELAQLDYKLMVAIMLVTGVGVILGTYAQRFLTGNVLRKIFGFTLIFVAIGMVVKTIY